MEKILVTGGSGFIGTNLIGHLSKDAQYEIQNIDIVKPKISAQDKYWVQVDLRNHDAVVAAVEAFAPDYVIHLGARTDLNGKTLQDYDANMSGVSNLLDAIEAVGTVKRAIFASSMYVCEPGYMPKDFEDYAPHTLYGESKVETEKRIKTANPSYTYYDGANDYDFRANALSEILYGQDATSPTMVCSTLFYQLQNTNDPRLYRICRHYYNIKRSQVKPDKEQNIDLTDDFLAYFQSKNLGEEPCNPGAAWYTDWMNPATLDDLPTLKKYAEIDENTYANSDYIARASRPCLNIDFEMPSCPGDLMSYAEVEFLKAEAATKGWNVGGGDAESHYEAGVRASMELLNNYYLTSNKISEDEINEFIANNKLGDNPKETINTQAWILHMMNPSEGWANMRRSDYPAILNRDLLTKNGFTYTDSDWSMPVRLQYPELEAQYNNANYKAAIDRMGGTDDWHKHLWWDKADVNLQPDFNPPFGKGYSK